MDENIYNPDYVRRLFDQMSSSYERVNYITSFGFSIRWRTQFLKSFHQPDQKVEVLDLLTGMGETWAATKHKLPNSHLSVLDFSEGMLSYAKQKNINRFNNEITVLHQNILQNQLPDNHYDFITCAFGLKTFNEEQLKSLALEVKRILKPGGRFSFIEVSKPEKKFLKALYGLYLNRVIPVLGRILLGNPKEYKMLWHYTNKFKDSKRATEIFVEAGLKTEFATYFYGCATGFYGSKL